MLRISFFIPILIITHIHIFHFNIFPYTLVVTKTRSRMKQNALLFSSSLRINFSIIVEISKLRFLSSWENIASGKSGKERKIYRYVPGFSNHPFPHCHKNNSNTLSMIYILLFTEIHIESLLLC